MSIDSILLQVMVEVKRKSPIPQLDPQFRIFILNEEMRIVSVMGCSRPNQYGYYEIMKLKCEENVDEKMILKSYRNLCKLLMDGNRVFEPKDITNVICKYDIASEKVVVAAAYNLDKIDGCNRLAYEQVLSSGKISFIFYTYRFIVVMDLHRCTYVTIFSCLNLNSSCSKKVEEHLVQVEEQLTF
jgi:hypothetical protein